MSIKIGAVIVAYHPDFQVLADNVRAIISQVDELLLIDNASGNEYLRALKEMFPTLVIHVFARNEGISGALNYAVDYFNSKGFAWLLTLDQDSICPENMIQSYRTLLDLENVAMISPTMVFTEGYVDQEFTPSSERYTIIKRCITSGALMSIPICQLLGRFDARLFIDYVDYDYTQTVIENGYLIIRDNQISMVHSIGEAVLKRKFFWKENPKIVTYNHSPLRLYYYTRNRIYYIYKHQNSVHKKREYRSLIRWIAIIFIYEKKRFRNAGAVFKGIIDSRSMIQTLKKERFNS